MTGQIENPSPWMNQPYVWMIILIPFTAIILGVAMLSLAISTDSGLVVDDYYKKGKEINRVLERDTRALSFGLGATVELDADLGLLRVRLASAEKLTPGDYPKIEFLHSTRSGMDQSIVLIPVNDGLFTAKFDSLAPGRWNVQISTAEWRIVGSLKQPGNNATQLRPSAQ